MVETLILYFVSSNGQVLFVETALSWVDAELDCELRGTNLLTAQQEYSEVYTCFVICIY